MYGCYDTWFDRILEFTMGSLLIAIWLALVVAVAFMLRAAWQAWRNK